MKLYPFQERARSVALGILKLKPGAILRMDEGLGKTHVAHSIAKKYNKVLWVGPAGTLPDIKKKIGKDWCTYVSYHGFPKPAIKPSDYDLIIFDECHHLRNWSAQWTQKFVRIGTKNTKLLFLSATPATKDVLDYKYIMRKCGCFHDFKGMSDVYIHFFSAKPSRYGDFLEKGEFINREDFVTRLEQVLFDMTKKDADEDLPPPIYNCFELPIEAEEAWDITEETKVRIRNGSGKVVPALALIQAKLEEKGIKKSLILGVFHENVQLLHTSSPFPTRIALDSKSVKQAFEDMKTQDFHLVTTMGLTQSSLDLNECDDIFIFESTYSFALDRQSISRCHRIGKRSQLTVNYIIMQNEATIKKAIPRAKLLDMKSYTDGARIRPSQLKILDDCPGSLWFQKPDTSWVAPYAFFGTQMHAALERFINKDDIEIPASVPEGVANCVKFCRGLRRSATRFGVEDKIQLEDNFRGTADFWCISDNTLTVLDYKNGKHPVDINDNLQLWAYTLMIIHTYKLDPEVVEHIVWQRDEKKTCIYEKNMIQYYYEKIKDIKARVMAAKNSPGDHLNKGDCSPFCAARDVHRKQSNRKRRRK